MMRWLGGAAPLFLSLPILFVFAEEPSRPTEQDWQLATLQDSFVVADGDVLRFRHLRGDVRIKTDDTDRVQITALAQYHTEDPRNPAIRFAPEAAGSKAPLHHLTVDFAHLEIAEQDAWSKRRIDIGLLVPKGTELEIETLDGVIEAKGITARAKLTSISGEITYKGHGDLTAYSERGAIRTILKRTAPQHILNLSTLTGDIRVMLLEGARAQIDVETRGPITTDYSIEIDREAGSPLKTGRVRIGVPTGTGEGSSIHLKSHSGGIRLQGLIAAEEHDL